MEEKSNINSLKEVNKALFQKMGLAKHHLEALEKETSSMEKLREKIIRNKDLEDSEKKKKLNELIQSSRNKINYHIDALKGHILPDSYSVKSYIETKKAGLKDEKEKQLKEGIEMGFITAEEADKRREKWADKEKIN